jgi:hypothetical protein
VRLSLSSFRAGRITGPLHHPSVASQKSVE